LDDDEIDYLDTVMEKERAKEQALKKETDEQLAAFRKHKQQVDKGVAGSPNEENITADQWSVTGKKRKQVVEKGSLVKGVKVRKTEGVMKSNAVELKEDMKSEVPALPTMTKPTVASLGLAGYSSDEED
jgi:hypothetical protein